MSQNDYVIANQALNAGRTDINNALSAIQSTNSGASAPTSTAAYMQWLDTTNSLLKMRNGADNAWLSILKSDGVQQYASGSTAALPAFSTDGDPNTGAFFPAADEYAISVAGSEAIRVDSSGKVGIGTTSPNATLEVNAATPILEIKASTDTLASLVLDSGATSDGVILFDLNNSTRWAMGLDASDAESFVLAASGGLGSSNRLKVNASGHVFMPSLSANAGTNLVRTGSGEIVDDTSSLQFKEKIQNIKTDTSLLYGAQGRTYVRKVSQLEEPGWIAEELFEILPEFVNLKDGKPYSIKYDRMVVPIIEEMKKLRDRIAILEGNNINP